MSKLGDIIIGLSVFVIFPVVGFFIYTELPDIGLFVWFLLSATATTLLSVLTMPIFGLLLPFFIDD